MKRRSKTCCFIKTYRRCLHVQEYAIQHIAKKCKEIILCVSLIVVAAYILMCRSESQISENKTETTETTQPTPKKITAKLMIYIRTAPNDVVDRSKLRQLWIADARQLGAHVMFLVGLSNKENANEQIIEEQRVNNDLLLFNFTDAYDMLSVKTFYNFRWHLENVENADNIIVVSTDMDGYLNVNNLLEYIKTNSIAKQDGYIHGDCQCTGICPGLGPQLVNDGER
jgi:hypothetical protein